MKRVATLMASAVLLVMGLAAPASAADVACGDTITTSIVLTHDLVDCAADGLKVGVSGITIDLGGYTIDGDDDTGTSDGAGVRINPFVTGVTVTNGTITGFSQGVQLDFLASGNLVTTITAVANVRGIDAANAGGNTIEQNTVVNNALDGIRINGFFSDNNIVRQNHVSGNVFNITVSDLADGNMVSQNTVAGGAFGVAVFVDAVNNVVSQNTVSGAALVAIQIEVRSNGATVERNTVSGSGLGILVKDTVSNATVARNNVTFNAGDGIQLSGQGGAVTRNNVSDNGGWGIQLTGTSSGYTLSRNNLANNAAGSILDSGTGNTIS